MTFKTSDGGSVNAHRVKVAAGLVHATLYGNMKERGQKELELPNIDSSIFQEMFCFIYTGQVQASLTTCLSLLQTADYFGIDALKTICLRMVKKGITLDNYPDVSTVAVEHLSV